MTLDAYLDAKGIKDADFAPLIDRDRSMVSKLRHGKVQPTLALAAKIRDVTAGDVPLESWLLDQSEEQEAA